MKYYLCNSLYPFPWEQVAQAHWCRYPNPESAHVLSEDTTFREVKNNQLHSKRLLTKTNRMPKWGECLVSSRQVSIIEESIVDPVKKEITTYTRNVGLTKLFTTSHYGDIKAQK
ncbi:preli-like isoform X2 [Oratosquilla oratoria]